MTTPTPDQLADCDACGEPIAPGDVLHVPSEELGPDIERVHRACYDANRPGRKPVWLEAPTPDQLGEAAERATPEDTSHDAGPNLEALAGSDAVEAVINLRLARERERNAEGLRRLVAWVIVGSLTLGFGLGLGLAALVLL